MDYHLTIENKSALYTPGDGTGTIRLPSYKAGFEREVLFRHEMHHHAQWMNCWERAEKRRPKWWICRKLRRWNHYKEARKFWDREYKEISAFAAALRYVYKIYPSTYSDAFNHYVNVLKNDPNYAKYHHLERPVIVTKLSLAFDNDWLFDQM